MVKLFLSVAFCLALLVSVLSRHTPPKEDGIRYSALGEPDQEWAYVNVRPAANMFYWLYKTTGDDDFRKKPLVMWLQGGPGGSSTGFGNFEEIGPLNVQLKPRSTTWLSAANLLFVDNPVGTGYSYVDNDSAYTTNVGMIATDLVTLFKSFLKKSPDFQKIPFYIFSESYGGKMTAAFSQALHAAIKSGQVNCDFRGFAMGDSWISPVDSVLTWGPYLYVNSLVDRTGLQKINGTAVKTAELVQEGKFTEATSEWSATETVVELVTNGVNFYNILKWGGEPKFYKTKGQRPSAIEKLYARHVAPMQNDDLSALMNGPIRQKLKIIPANVTWGGQSGMVFVKQSGDFMKPVTDIVNGLIDNTDLSVVVYNGQLDLIVDTLGTEAWVYNLNIAGQFHEASRNPILVNGITNAFIKKAKNFSFYWILDAGHMIPADNGRTALKMLQMVLGQA